MSERGSDCSQDGRDAFETLSVAAEALLCEWAPAVSTGLQCLPGTHTSTQTHGLKSPGLFPFLSLQPPSSHQRATQYPTQQGHACRQTIAINYNLTRRGALRSDKGLADQNYMEVVTRRRQATECVFCLRY